MVTIGRIPRVAQAFFRPLREHFAVRAWQHFWGLVLAITISHGSTIDRLTRRLRGSTHRTNHGEFLWRSVWSETAVMQQIALDLLMSLYRKGGGPCYLILDDTQTLKRAKRMAGVGKSTLLRRIKDDLELERSEQARRYRYHLFYRFPRLEPLTPESRCLDLLGRLAKELNYPLPDIGSEARRRASEEERPEQVPRQQLFNDHLDRLKPRFAEPTLLLFDCTTRLDPGIVRVLDVPEEAGFLGPDSILVCPSTDPGWTPLFLGIRALIAERGGILSHGAVVAREFGIPAVSCPDATRFLQDGVRVRVDGTQGLVTVLDRHSRPEKDSRT